MKQLTKAEEEVMQILWELERSNVAGIIEKLPEPKPAYNTVSTIVRILESKGFVDHQQQGKGYTYFPLIKKSDYSHRSLEKLVEGYFQGSYKSLVSFFMKKEDLSLQELEALMKELKKDKS